MKITLLFLLFFIYCSVYAFKSSDERVAEKFLSEFYEYDQTNGNFKDSLKEMQKMAGIEPDGILTEEVISYMNKGRCGCKDRERKNKRFSIGDLKWESGLTYNFFLHLNWMPRTMNENEVRTAFKFGLDYWMKISNIGFAESKYTLNSKFSLSFSSKDHESFDVNKDFQPSRDPTPLDNVPGGVLAHGYYPRNGNLHFDNAETWTEGTYDGINLRLFAAHEMGHSIGLKHSDDPKALMNPWYGGYVSVEDFKLANDDIQGAQSLYGARGKRAMPPTKRELGKLQSKLCNSKTYQSIFRFSDDKLYVVADNYEVYRLDGGKVDETFKPVELKDDMKNADSMFYDNANKRMIIFRGDKILSATGSDIKNLKLKELEIGGHGAFLGKCSAAFGRDISSKEGLQYFWLIQDKEIISGKLVGNKVFFSRRSRPITEIISMSSGAKLPTSIDAAYLDGEKDGLLLHLFIGNSYYIGKPKGRKQFKYFISAEYPKSFKGFLNC